jgi:hypothetical protein
VPLLGGSLAGLGNLGVELPQQIGGYLLGLDGVCDAPEDQVSKGSAGSGTVASIAHGIILRVSRTCMSLALIGGDARESTITAVES